MRTCTAALAAALVALVAQRVDSFGSPTPLEEIGDGNHNMALAHIKQKGFVTATELRAHLAEEHREHVSLLRNLPLAACDL